MSACTATGLRGLAGNRCGQAEARGTVPQMESGVGTRNITRAHLIAREKTEIATRLVPASPMLAMTNHWKKISTTPSSRRDRTAEEVRKSCGGKGTGCERSMQSGGVKVGLKVGGVAEIGACVSRPHPAEGGRGRPTR